MKTKRCSRTSSTLLGHRDVSTTLAQFENKTVQPHFINPICFGEDVAAWLIARLPQPPLVVSEPVQEDYGWGFWTQINDEPYWTAVAIDEAAIGQEVAEWMVSVNYDPGFNLARRLWKRPREENLLMLRRALDSALRSEPVISDIQWWRDDGKSFDHPE